MSGFESGDFFSFSVHRQVLKRRGTAKMRFANTYLGHTNTFQATWHSPLTKCNFLYPYEHRMNTDLWGQQQKCGQNEARFLALSLQDSKKKTCRSVNIFLNASLSDRIIKPSSNNRSLAPDKAFSTRHRLFPRNRVLAV